MNFSLIKTPASSIKNRLWGKFANSKKFRDEYVAGYVKRAIPAQIRALMKKRGLTQQKLAEQSGLTQGVISRAADLNYGDLSLNTIIRIGAGFDCAFVGKYVPYTEFLRETKKGVITDIPSFEKENEALQEKSDKEPSPLGLGSQPQQELDFDNRGQANQTDLKSGRKPPQSAGTSRELQPMEMGTK